MTESSHPRLDLDPALLNPVRLSLVSALAARDALVFKEAKKLLGLSDSVLSKQSSALEELGYLSIHKGFTDSRRPYTRLKLTSKGYQAWQTHIGALTRIANDDLD